MIKVLITGRIASGKSTVCRLLKERGYAVYDSDSRVKSLYEEIPGLKGRIEAALGVPFSQIGVIFTDERKKRTLEDIVYPLLREDFRRFALEAGDVPAVFFESAVAFGNPHFEGEFDSVVLVRSPYGERARRNPKVVSRDPLQSDVPLCEADYIIDNDSDPDSLKGDVDAMLSAFALAD